jgi:hypothetical protein
MYPNDAYETYERNGLTVSIFPDDDPMSPAEWDTLGTLVAGSSLWREYRFTDEHVDTEYRDIAVYIRAARIAGCAVLPFRFDDYGSSGATIRETSDMDRCNGYLCASKEDVDKEREGFPDWNPMDALRAELEAWNQYVSGDVYSYTLTTPEGTVLDSLWGLYGLNYAKEEADRAADAYSAEDVRRADCATLHERREELATALDEVHAKLAALGCERDKGEE